MKKTRGDFIGGARATPPEDCCGPLAFIALKQKYSVWYISERLLEIIEQKDLDDYFEELHEYRYWLTVDKFDRRAVKRRLKQYAAGGDN